MRTFVEETAMTKRLLVATVIQVLLTCLSAMAQQPQTIPNHCPYSQQHWNELACLIPDLTTTGTSDLRDFNTTLASVIGELPVAVPVSGFALTLDKSTGVYVVSSDLGGVLTERGSTLGKNKFFLGFTYQHFNFDEIDGTKLSNIPTVSALNGALTGAFLSSTNNLQASIDQYTIIAAYGVTDRIDVSVTLPIDNVSLSGTASNRLEATNNGQPATAFAPLTIGGAASGVGDVFVNGKFGIVKGEHSQLAGGLEVRFATGNEYNLLGSGAWGIKPYIVFSRLGRRFHPHANLGFQWNSQSVLNLSAAGNSLRLPDSLVYSAGVDYSVAKHLTIVGDFIGQHFSDAPTVTRAQVATPANVQGSLALGPACPASGCNVLTGNVSTVGVNPANSFDEDNLAVGIKVNPFGKLVVSGNVLIKLNNAGLRANYVPLVGVSYKF
jgi:hypothetical protein